MDEMRNEQSRFAKIGTGVLWRTTIEIADLIMLFSNYILSAVPPVASVSFALIIWSALEAVNGRPPDTTHVLDLWQRIVTSNLQGG